LAGLAKCGLADGVKIFKIFSDRSRTNHMPSFFRDAIFISAWQRGNLDLAALQ
jgi:hypothetical protein